MTGRCHSVLSRWGSIRSLLYTLVVGGLLLHPLSLPAADTNLQSLFNFQTKMASRGNTDAMIKLGEMCEEGLGTEKSEQHAREWYQKALDNGNLEGQTHLERLEKKLKRAAQEQAAREQAAREQAAREQAERELAMQRQEEAARQEMSAEEKARARDEAIRRAEEAYRQSLEKQLAKEKAESDALKRSRSVSAK